MRSKTDFYRLFFEQLARRGFDVKRSQSSDYIADIYFKNQLVAYFSKADTVIQNPFVTVKDKLIRTNRITISAGTSGFLLPFFSAAISGIMPQKASFLKTFFHKLPYFT